MDHIKYSLQAQYVITLTFKLKNRKPYIQRFPNGKMREKLIFQLLFKSCYNTTLFWNKKWSQSKLLPSSNAHPLIIHF